MLRSGIPRYLTIRGMWICTVGSATIAANFFPLADGACGSRRHDRHALHQVRVAVRPARREVAVVHPGSEQQHRLASLRIDRLRHPQIGYQERTRFARRGGRVARACGNAFDPEFDRRGRHSGLLRLGGVERDGRPRSRTVTTRKVRRMFDSLLVSSLNRSIIA